MSSPVTRREASRADNDALEALTRVASQMRCGDVVSKRVESLSRAVVVVVSEVRGSRSKRPALLMKREAAGQGGRRAFSAEEVGLASGPSTELDDPCLGR